MGVHPHSSFRWISAFTTSWWLGPLQHDLLIIPKIYPSLGPLQNFRSDTCSCRIAGERHDVAADPERIMRACGPRTGLRRDRLRAPTLIIPSTARWAWSWSATGFLGRRMRITSSPPGRQNFGHHNIAVPSITRGMVDNADGSGLMLPPPGRLHRGPALGGPQCCRRTVHDPDLRGARCRPPPSTSYSRQRAAQLHLPRPRTGNTSASSSSAPRQRNVPAGTLLPV